jgi:hypothetical protein
MDTVGVFDYRRDAGFFEVVCQMQGEIHPCYHSALAPVKKGGFY